MDRLDTLAEGESGRSAVSRSQASDDATQAAAPLELSKVLRGQDRAGTGCPGRPMKLAARPEGPAIACRVRLKARRSVGAGYRAATRRRRTGCRSASSPCRCRKVKEKFDATRFADGVAEGVLNRLVRAQVIKGRPPEKGKADLPDPDRECVTVDAQRAGARWEPAAPRTRCRRCCSGICVSPRRSLTIPATKTVVKTLGLKKGIKLIALDLSGL